MNSIFSNLHTRHTQLLQQMRAARDRKQFVADAQSLLRDLRLAGRSVTPDQRERLESYAGYWGAFISENTGEYLDTTLDSEAIGSTRPAGSDRLTLIYENAEERTVSFLAPDQPSEPLVGRDELLLVLKRRLFTGDLALYGPPGIGKTILAVSLAHDKELLAHFSDGVLWANLGRLGVTGTLNAWAAALEIPRHKFAAMSSLEDRQRALREKIGLRRMLLVVDEVREEASALKLGGPNCAHLCTTRSIKAAVAFATDGFTVVNGMTTTESLTLLSKFVPEAVESHPDMARELVARTDGVPLTLALTGRYLQATLHQGQLTDGLRSLVARWQQEGTQVASLPPSQDNALLEAATPASLLLAIAIIEEALDEGSRRMFRALSVFAPKPNSFSQEAALTVSEAPATALEKLLAFGLLERADSSRYAVYQPIDDYAQAKLADEAAYERMVDFYIRYAEAYCEDYQALDQEWSNVRAALETASKRGMRDRLLRGVNAIYRYLEIRGLYPVARDLLSRAREAAESLNDTSGLTAILLAEGRLAEKQGDYLRAKGFLDRGLSLARQTGDRKKTADLLLVNGIVEGNRGDLARARGYVEEALDLVQGEESPKAIGEIYSRLGVLTRNQGAFEQAERYLHEGLDLARRIFDPDLISELLLHLGVMEWMRGNPATAEANLKEGLTLARQIGNLERIAAFLHAFSLLARGSDAYGDPEAMLQEALALFREIGHRWYISIVLVEQGELGLKKRKPDTATAAFLQALATANETGSLHIVALALDGLARAAELRGDIAEAQRQGQASLVILEAIGHMEAARVKAWLAALSSQVTLREPDRDAGAAASVARGAEDANEPPRPVSA